ncbi:MAG: hypothetical protein AB7Q16_06930 [Vicinamibacterales bacterium]
MTESTRPARPRGRPPKFDRPSQLVTFTLPDDVLAWLKSLHADPAWAIVKLHEKADRRARKPVELAELVQLPQGRALIMVNTEALKHLAGVSVIPMSDGRGILALEVGKGVADLELAVIDRLEAKGVGRAQREALQALRERLREWRQQGVRFEARTIIVANRPSTSGATRLAPAQAVGRGGPRDVA